MVRYDCSIWVNDDPNIEETLGGEHKFLKYVFYFNSADESKLFSYTF